MYTIKKMIVLGATKSSQPDHQRPMHKCQSVAFLDSKCSLFCVFLLIHSFAIFTPLRMYAYVHLGVIYAGFGRYFQNILYSNTKIPRTPSALDIQVSGYSIVGLILLWRTQKTRGFNSRCRIAHKCGKTVNSRRHGS